MTNDRPYNGSFTRDMQALIASGALHGSFADYAEVPGRSVFERTEAFYEWRKSRIRWGVWPFSNSVHQAIGPEITISNEAGSTRRGINFASQDYLGLSADERVCNAAIEAIRTFGPHSASSPSLQGNSTLSLQLEEALAHALDMECVTLFSTGWAAGFGTIVGLIRKTDHVILDQYAHNCCVQGALAATSNVSRVRHLSTNGFVKHLRRIRAKDSTNAILVVTEGIFSMNADTPDIASLQEACREFDATLLVDVAHDFGACGRGGTGALGIQEMLGKVDLVVGSFSKVFASNGGFVATQSQRIKDSIRGYGCSFAFSNAISPVQCAVALTALEIMRGSEGEKLRNQVISVANCIRDSLGQEGIQCLGAASPLVPVLLGDERIARITWALCFDAGVFANLVEFPAVSVGASRFRLQLMASHTLEQAREAARLIGKNFRRAAGLLEENLSETAGIQG